MVLASWDCMQGYAKYISPACSKRQPGCCPQHCLVHDQIKNEVKCNQTLNDGEGYNVSASTANLNHIHHCNVWKSTGLACAACSLLLSKQQKRSAGAFRGSESEVAPCVRGMCDCHMCTDRTLCNRATATFLPVVLVDDCGHRGKCDIMLSWLAFRYITICVT